LTPGEGTVHLGRRVRIHSDDGEEELSIVPPYDADAAGGYVSMDSPLGGALIGRAVGEAIEVRTPGGVRVVTVVAVS
jgi:transcription elongation GreA/GreB family factor